MTKTSTFVRALFGDSVIQRRDKVLEDAERTLGDSLQPAPLVTFAYGRENYEWLRERGVDAALASERAVIDWDQVGWRTPEACGQLSYGYSLWKIKLDAMRRALKDHDEIVWLDFDAHLLKPLPPDFWDRMQAGRPIQMPLVSYKVRTCRWRGSHDQRSVPEGAFIYVRDPQIIEQAIELYAEPDRRWWTDQMILALVMDQMAGKPGPDEFTTDGYKEDGFEPYCVSIYNEFHEPEDDLFVVGRGRPHEVWMRKKGRLNELRNAEAAAPEAKE